FAPAAPGDYLISIKFAGINIAGSPFKCTVGELVISTPYCEHLVARHVQHHKRLQFFLTLYS
ncbi:unnamed protein product, partial [Rotaria magnacalcarata]